jgi:hypothetical protein
MIFTPDTGDKALNLVLGQLAGDKTLIGFADILPDSVTQDASHTFTDEVIVPASGETTVWVATGRSTTGTEGWKGYEYDLTQESFPYSYVYDGETTTGYGLKITTDQSGFGPHNIFMSTLTPSIDCRAGDVINVDATFTGTIRWLSENPSGTILGYDFSIFYRKNGMGPWYILFQVFYEVTNLGTKTTLTPTYFAAPAAISGLRYEVETDTSYEFVMGVDFYAEQADDTLINYPRNAVIYGNSIKIQRTRR